MNFVKCPECNGAHVTVGANGYFCLECCEDFKTLELKKQIKHLQRRCRTLSRGTLCGFCKMECEVRECECIETEDI